MARASLRQTRRDGSQSISRRWKSQLDRLELPATAILGLVGEPAALWSEDRGVCLMNRALIELLGCEEHEYRNHPKLWAARVDEGDRERFHAFCGALPENARASSCDYRFLPTGQGNMIELRETVLRLVAPGGAGLLLSRYAIRSTGEPRDLAHAIGNHLQAARGEVDLLRLSGTLPERSALTLCQAIDAVHELVQEIRKRES